MQQSISIEAARIYLAQLDLGYIIHAMCDQSYPLPRWTKEDAEECCKRYKNFLLLQKMHAPFELVPSRLIDEFWHNHILYTKRYIEDCMQIFGHYLHHQPASPSESPEELVDGFKKTKELYLQEFGTTF
jgi:hypothetical protein